MLKSKKSFAAILSLVMLLAMAGGAWAADWQAEVYAEGVTKTNSLDISVTGEKSMGLWAYKQGKIISSGDISTDGLDAHGVYALSSSDIAGSGDITTSGDVAIGLLSLSGSTIAWVGNISTNATTAAAHGVRVLSVSSVDVTGDIVVNGYGSGIVASNGSYARMAGNITTYGPDGYGLYVLNNTGVEGITRIIVSSGDIVTYGKGAAGAAINESADVTISGGNVITYGEAAYGLSVNHWSTLTMTGGSIEVADTSFGMRVHNHGTINLENVTADLENLLHSFSSGTVNATDSTLAGDILLEDNYDGGYAAVSGNTLDINLTDTSLTSATKASDDICVINIDLEGSAWNITGDSNTNGTVTGDGSSTISYTLSPEETEVIIDKLKGNANIDMKIGDSLIIKNAEGTISSSNNDVVEVIKDDVTGEVSIISKADGEAELTYSYVDQNGNIQTVTVTVVSGAGSDPESNNYGGGGSSNCSAGFGATALLSLLGMALVLKRK